MDRALEHELQHLYLAGGPMAAAAALVDRALADDYRERNDAAIEALDNANVDQIFSESDSESFDELLDELAEHIAVDSKLYKSFIAFQTDLLARATNAANHIEAAGKILEGRT